jgi:hypothetical protein
LVKVWRDGVRVKGDYARYEADIIAVAASLQMVTTKVGEGRFANSWHITSKGLHWLSEQEQT